MERGARKVDKRGDLRYNKEKQTSPYNGEKRFRYSLVSYQEKVRACVKALLKKVGMTECDLVGYGEMR